MDTGTARRLTAKEVEVLDPYMLMAVLGKRVIHPGGKLSTEELFRRADFATGQRVLDVGCGVGRPDLEASPEETRARAHTLHRSLNRILDLRSETLVLPGHTSEPVAFDGKPLAGTLAQVHEKVEALGASEDAFVEAILARISPVPPNHHRIVESNEAGLLPGRSHGPRGGREPPRGLLAI